MNLYLIRHAVAFKRDHERWPDDADRPLTPDGEEDFRAAARGLKALVPDVETLLSSPYARAWRTAELIVDEASWASPVEFPALEPDIPPWKTLAALEDYKELGSLALVGHRPNLHELASYLLIGAIGIEDGLNIGLKKGGAACLQFEGPPEPGAAKLRWLLTPKALCLANGH